MAGHSKWNNIKRTKGANDAKRNKLFTKLVRDITNATKIGESGDPDFNPMLKVAINKAKAANLPNDKIKVAVDRGLGIQDSNNVVFYNTYEAYSPDGVAVLIDTETDNPNRTITEIRNIINKAGGKMANEGSLSWQFEEEGLIKLILASSVDKDEVELALIEIEGIKDIKHKKNVIEVKTQKEMLKVVSEGISSLGIGGLEVDLVEIAKIANNILSVSDVQKEKLKSFIDQVEENADVVSIWVNTEL